MKGIARGMNLNAVRATLARIISLLATFLLTIVVARILVPSASGTFFLVFTTLAVLATFARFGTDNLALKLTTASRANIVREVHRLYGICVTFGVIAFLGSGIAVVVLHESFPGLATGVALAAAGAVIPQALAVLSGAVLRGTGRLSIGTFAELGSLPLLTIVILLGTALTGAPSLSSSVVALTVASWITAAWSVPAALRSVRSGVTLRPVKSEPFGAFLRGAIGPLLSMMATSLLFYVLTWAPQYVLAVTSGPRDVALFTVAARLASFVALVPTIQIAYLAPAFARLFHRGDIADLNALCNRSVWQAALAALVPTLALTAGAGLVLSILYGTAYASATEPLILLVSSSFLVVLFGQVNQLMLLCGLETRAMVLNVSVLIGWATIGLLAGAVGGVDGICAFALVSSVAYAALSSNLLRKRLGIRSYFRPALRGANRANAEARATGTPSGRTLYYCAGILATVTASGLALWMPAGALGLVALVGLLVLLRAIGVWRTMVGVSIVASVLRSGPLTAYLSDTIWYALQFLPLLIATAVAVAGKGGKLRRSDHAVIAFLFLYAACALGSTLISDDPNTTLQQSLLLLGMTAFLVITFTRRWKDAGIIRGDLTIVFWVITVTQAIGVAATLLGQSWPLDPDYGRYRGLFSNANYAGAIAAAAIMLGVYLLRSTTRWLRVVPAILVLLIALVSSGSRGAILALVIGVLILVVTQTSRKVVLPFLFVTGFVTGLVLLAMPSAFSPLATFFTRDASVANDPTSGRLTIYQTLFQHFVTSPITGTGYHTTDTLTGGLAAHNTYLSVLTETGILGFGAFAGVVISLLAASRAGRAARPLVSVVTTIAVIELTESSIYGFGGPTALSFWMIALAFAANGRFLETSASPSEAVAIDVSSAMTAGRDEVLSGYVVRRG